MSPSCSNVCSTVSPNVSPSDRPIRRCVVCREPAPQRELLRVVRRPDGVVTLAARDPGRGAYIHRQSDCLATAASTPRYLARALRQSPPDEILHQIALSAPN